MLCVLLVTTHVAPARKPTFGAPAPTHTHSIECLDDLMRRSLCCHAPVIHPRPFGGRRFADTIALACAYCGSKIGKFEVVNEQGEQFCVASVDGDGVD